MQTGKLSEFSVSVLLGAVVVLGSCRSYPSVTSTELPGTYVAHHVDIDDSIVVRENGQFDHRAWSNRKEIVNESGKWEMVPYPDGEPAIQFLQFSPVVDKLRKLPIKPAAWHVPIDKDRSGRVTLLVNEDLHLSYHRLNDPGQN